MPRVKSVKSLSKACIDFIIKIQDSFCNKMSVSELEDGVLEAMDSEKSAINPFDELPSCLSEELFKIGREKLLRKADFYKISPFLSKLLTTSNLRTLDLTHTDEEGINLWPLQSRILNIATVKSTYLETLRLDSFHSHHQEHLHFISKFSKLRVLEISFTKAGNDCFQILGAHCPELRELLAESCQVSDDGIRELCVTGKCKSINVLDLTGCECITTKAMQMALDSLPELKILRHEFLIEWLAGIAQNALDQKLKLPNYSLSTLHVLGQTVYESGSLGQSLLLCPNVTKVVFDAETEGLRGREVSSIISQKLCVFEMNNYARKIEGYKSISDKELTMGEDFVPIIRLYESTFKKVGVEEKFIKYDAITILKRGPNVENPYVAYGKCHRRRARPIQKGPVIKKLKTLR